MNIYRCGPFFQVSKESNAHRLLSSDGLGRSMLFDNGRLSYLGFFSDATNPRKIAVIGETRYTLFGEEMISLENFLNGKLRLESDLSNSPTLRPETAFAHAYKNFFALRNSKMVSLEENVPGKRKNSIFFFDFDEELFVCKESSISLPEIIDGYIYGWERKKKQLVKLDLGLNEIWRSIPCDVQFLHKSGSIRSRTPSKITDNILMNLGHSNNDVVPVNNKKIQIYKNGLLYCYFQKDGALNWFREFDSSIEDVLVAEERLFVTTSTKLLELDPDSGETIREIETGLEIPEDFDRQSVGCLAELHASGARLYYFHWISGTILVYDLATLELSRQLRLPGGWRPRGVQFEDEDTGNLYIDVALGAGGPPDYHRLAMLELKPDHLDEPIEIEQGPPASIYMACSETDPEKEELWVEITTSSLDDALRFGTLHTQNHAYIQGRTLVSQHCDPNPRFNGKVHFRYSGSTEPEERVSAMLALVEESFNKWNKQVGVYAGDGSKDLCQIDVQYVSNS